MIPFLLCIAAIFVLPLLLAMSARLVVAGASEFRARVLETVAAAVHRGIAVEPQFLWLIAHDVRGRRRRAVLRAAKDVDDGRPLSVALGHALRLQPEAISAISAADGTSALRSALREAARVDRGRMDFHHRLLVRLAYPTIIVSFMGGFLGYGIAPKFHDVCASMEIDCSTFLATFDVAKVLAVLLLAVTGVVVIFTIPPVRRMVRPLRGLRRHPPAECVANWLHTFAGAVGAGRPLDVALDRTASAIGHRRHEAAVHDAAEFLRQGGTVEAAWKRLPISGWLHDRAPTLAGPPEILAGALVELATAAQDRALAARERFLTLLTPLMLTIAGGSIGAILLAFMLILERLRGGIGPW